MANVPASNDTKAAILAALQAGESISAVARTFSLSRQTIMKYRNAAGLNTTRVAHEKQAELGGLVLEHVRTSLLALAAQARVATDPAWISQQSANDLAILFGVMSDKTHRILSALQSVASGDEDADEGEPGPLAP